MKDILMLGVYDYNIYSRGRIIYKGLKENKVKVELFNKQGTLKYFQIIKRILRKDYKKLFVTGKIVLLISWIFKPIHGKEIIFDAFISDYDTLVKDRCLVKDGSFKSKILRFGDKWSCRLGDKIITDTTEHTNYFVKEFSAKKNKFHTVFIGADNDLFKVQKTNRRNNKFVVEYHGTFIPLQGIDIIIRSAKLIKDKDIIFRIIGNGQTYSESVKLAHKLKVNNVEFINFQPLKKVCQEINNSDIGLGIFGTTSKAKRVIPNKAYEIIACKKPLITGDTIAIRRFFRHEENCLLVETGNYVALAKEIVKIKKNKELRTKIAKNGKELFDKYFSNKQIGEEVKKIIS